MVQKREAEVVALPLFHVVGYKVEASELGDVPLHMASHTVGESKYAAYTHMGLEAELSRSYNYLYGEWMEETGHVPQHYDFEVWDERYHGEFTNPYLTN
ncbi:GyrI-like domain-containing protein [Paenibacillus algorifonticola]|uniref:GyrI-like domain-containing protein n=1 Tax=Paenibacillus algorifonticola TaxID=684063 RepID=UPI003D2C89FF